MMKNVFLFLTLLCGTLLISSCDKDDPAPPDEIDSFDDGVFISCEGAFGQGNAVIYFLDPQKMGYIPGIYNLVNQKPLGDVLQSIEFEDDNAYLVVNNSGKIVEVNAKTYLETGSIEGLSSPTEIDIEDGKGYIGSLYSRYIQVADLNSLTVTDSIFLGEQSNYIREDDNRLWVLSQSEYQGRVKDHIYFINRSDSTVDSLMVGSNPLAWTFDDNDQLYVYCQGIESGDGPAIYSVNMTNPAVTATTEVNASAGFFGRLAFDEFQNRILVQLPDGIYTFKPGDSQISGTPLFPLDNIQFLYALDVSPENGDIYVGDAKDFSSAGSVIIYSGDGQAKTTFQVGIGPNHFYFE